MWRSLVARFVRDEEVAGSNPVTPTIKTAGHHHQVTCGSSFTSPPLGFIIEYPDPMATAGRSIPTRPGSDKGAVWS